MEDNQYIIDTNYYNELEQVIILSSIEAFEDPLKTLQNGIKTAIFCNIIYKNNKVINIISLIL